MKLFNRFWNHLRHHPLTLAWLILPVGLGIGAYVYEDWRGREALAEEIAKWRAAGLALTWEDVRAEQKAPAPGDDFFNAPIIAEWLAAAPGKDREKTRLAYFPKWPQMHPQGRRGEPKRNAGSDVGIIRPVPYDWLDPIVRPDADQARYILTLLAPEAPVLDEVAEAVKRPGRRLGKLNDEKPLSEWSLAEYELGSPVMKIHNMLMSRARANFYLGNPEEAFDDTLALLRLARAHDHPGGLCLGRMVSETLHLRTTELVWEGLARGSWNESQLAELSLTLEPLQPAAAFLEAFRTEEALNALIWTDPQSRINSIFRTFGSGKSWESVAFWCRTIDFLGPQGSGHQIVRARLRLAAEELYMPGGVRSHEVEVAHLDRFEARRKATGRSLYEKWAWKNPRWVQGLGESALRNQQKLDLTRIAVALERWRLEKGNYPAALADLTPRFLPTIPEDRFVPGRAVSYVVSPGGHYQLYACGDDRVDDGGKPAPGPAKKGDIVWKLVP